MRSFKGLRGFWSAPSALPPPEAPQIARRSLNTQRSEVPAAECPTPMRALRQKSSPFRSNADERIRRENPKRRPLQLQHSSPSDSRFAEKADIRRLIADANHICEGASAALTKADNDGLSVEGQ